MSEPITFQAQVYKVATLADMGLRVTLDLPEDAVMQAAQLMECKRAGIVLQVVCSVPDKPEDLIKLDENAKQTGEGAEKRTTRVGRRRS
jgi:hypothetical protein